MTMTTEQLAELSLKCARALTAEIMVAVKDGEPEMLEKVEQAIAGGCDLELTFRLGPHPEIWLGARDAEGTFLRIGLVAMQTRARH